MQKSLAGKQKRASRLRDQVVPRFKLKPNRRRRLPRLKGGQATGTPGTEAWAARGVRRSREVVQAVREETRSGSRAVCPRVLFRKLGGWDLRLSHHTRLANT